MTQTDEDAAVERGAQMARALHQYRALRDWQKNPEGDRPETPDYDIVKANYDNGGSTMKAKTDKTPRAKASTDVRIFHDGTSMPESHKHKLSTCAYFYTRGIASKDSERLATKDFLALLVKLGVAEPTTPGWMVKLPNGITIEMRKDGDKSQFSGTPAKAARKTTTKAAAKPVTKPAPAKTTKPIAKKTPGQKARESKPAAKATAKKVTTNFKQPAKKTAAKKTVAAARSTRRTAKR